MFYIAIALNMGNKYELKLLRIIENVKIYGRNQSQLLQLVLINIENLENLDKKFSGNVIQHGFSFWPEPIFTIEYEQPHFSHIPTEITAIFYFAWCSICIGILKFVQHQILFHL